MDKNINNIFIESVFEITFKLTKHKKNHLSKSYITNPII